MVKKTAPLVSIIILTYNQRRFLEKSLPIIFNQRYKNFEVIIVDSNSNDGTLDLLKQFPIKLVKYKGPYGSNFSYPKAFNEGVKKSKGEILVRLSGDVIPVNRLWLRRLVKPLRDNKVAGTYSRQIYNGHCDLHHKFLCFFIFSDFRKVSEMIAPGLLFWGAAAAIRRSVYDKLPFNELQRRGEDSLWALEVSTKGYKLEYARNSVVVHNHEKEFKESLTAVAGSLGRFAKFFSYYILLNLLKFFKIS